MVQENGASDSPGVTGETQGSYVVLSQLIAGMVVYGAIGWGLGKWLGLELLFPLGMIVGLVLSVAMIIFRYSRT